MKKILLILLSIVPLSVFAQTESAKNPFSVNGYIETYYSYDFGNPAENNRPGFVYSHNRHNEVNLNLGFIRAMYQTERVRANLALMTGTYANANLAAEPNTLRNIFEANAGVKLSQSDNLWIDAGVFASHIGFESAIGKDCWNLTRSIMADNSPYFLSGVKISYTSDNQQWFLSGLILNGWQRIQRVNGNSAPAFGHQVTFKPNSSITLNSSSFIGSDTPDSIRQMRYFHNFYGQFQVHEKLGIILGFDIGAQQKAKGSSEYNLWYTPVLIAKYSVSDKMSIAARAEYYNDANQVIISTGTANGFQTYGYSLNIDYQLMDNVVWRIEGRGFSSKDEIFNMDKQLSTQNYFLTTALAVSL
ncbi:MAG: porin [Candidatus Kapabacteria bacterium]|nr:porin [Candidatus Kapabacteria bacterium]